MEDYKGHGMYQCSHLWKESALCARAAVFVIYVSRQFPMASVKLQTLEGRNSHHWLTSVSHFNINVIVGSLITFMNMIHAECKSIFLKSPALLSTVSLQTAAWQMQWLL